MQQIAAWLEKLGLGQYAQRFAENDISFGILPHLTDQDLKELGVASLGHRRTLEALTAQMQALSRQNPVLMIFEDVHWTDPTSLEAFGRAMDRLRTLPVLLI